MKKIKLTQGKYALVDDEDYDRLMQYKWTAELCWKSGNYYARNRRKLNIMMRRFILRLESSSKLVVDHIRHNTLDNRKKYLRVCTQAENCRNRKKK